MNKLGLSALICVLCATAACSRLREPTDAQLGTLLASDHANPAEVNAPLDTNAIECMRSWSGDTELLKGLPMRVAGEDGQKSCRGKLDGLLGSAARNPDKFSFQDVTAPKVVRRAIELQNARRQAALADPSRRQVPPGLMTSNSPAPAAFGTPDPNVNLGVAGSELEEAERLCVQAQQAAAEPDANPRVKSYAAYCVSTLRKLRSTMEQAARNGQGQQVIGGIAASATNLANTARTVLALGKQ